MKTILITGGAGFLGAKTALRLATDPKNDFLIKVLDIAPENESVYSRLQAGGNLMYIQGDMTSLSDLTKAGAGTDVIIHLARSEDPLITGDLLDYNCSMTDNISRFAESAKLEKIVLASSFQVYGNNAKAGVSENVECRPVSNYAFSKYLSEKMVSRLSVQTGIPAVILRYFNIYGPGASTGILQLLVDKAVHPPRHAEGVIDLPLRNDGNDGRDYIHIDDAVSAIFHAMNYPDPNNGTQTGQTPPDLSSAGCSVFNVGTGRCTTVKDLLRMFEMITGVKIHEHYGTDVDSIRNVSADCSKMYDLLGMKPVIPLEEGIKTLASTF